MDQIGNMINMIKNANRVGRESVSVPHSNIKFAIANCLKNEGYLKSVSKKSKKGFPVLDLGLVYLDKQPKITGVERISKLSRRVYVGVHDIKTSRGDRGIIVLTTPKGVLTNKQARKELVGGEVLFKIW